jgi:hypothetical protein
MEHPTTQTNLATPADDQRLRRAKLSTAIVSACATLIGSVLAFYALSVFLYRHHRFEG